MKKHLLLIFVCLSTLGLLIVTHYSELPAAHAQALVARESHVSGSSSQVSMKATSSGNLQYWGGTVLLHPHVYVTYWNWTSDPASEASYLESFFRGVGGSTWLNTVTQYNDTRGIFISNPANQFSGSWSDPTPIPSHPTRAQMAQEAVNTAAHFGNPLTPSTLLPRRKDTVASTLKAMASCVRSTTSGRSTPARLFRWWTSPIRRIAVIVAIRQA